MNYCTPKDIAIKLNHIGSFCNLNLIFEVKGEPNSFGVIRFTWPEQKRWQEVNVYIPSSGKDGIRKNVLEALLNFDNLIMEWYDFKNSQYLRN